MKDNIKVQKERALTGFNDKDRHTETLRLPKPVKCNCCQRVHTHSVIVGAFDRKRLLFWFQCHCMSTLAVRVKTAA